MNELSFPSVPSEISIGIEAEHTRTESWGPPLVMDGQEESLKETGESERAAS